MFSEKNRVFKTKSVSITLFTTMYVSSFLLLSSTMWSVYLLMSYFLNDLEELPFSFLNRVLFCLKVFVKYM